MHCCAVTDAGLGCAAGLYPHLTSLQLKSEALTDAGLARLAALPDLERLELVDCEGVEGRGIPALLPSLPRLLVRIPLLPCPASTPAASGGRTLSPACKRETRSRLMPRGDALWPEDSCLHYSMSSDHRVQALSQIRLRPEKP
jgi:hypothetical protein